MRYFYDLEFNDLGYGDIELISIGMVCEDGREYYAVNDQINVVMLEANQWLMDNVWPHILQTKQADIKGLNQIAREVQEFMSMSYVNMEGGTRDTNQLWAYYGAYDHVVMCRQLWGRMELLPDNVPMWTHELYAALGGCW